jgi:hypothetical protein
VPSRIRAVSSSRFLWHLRQAVIVQVDYIALIVHVYLLLSIQQFIAGGLALQIAAIANDPDVLSARLSGTICAVRSAVLACIRDRHFADARGCTLKNVITDGYCRFLAPIVLFAPEPSLCCS